jgi:hypothetical protein
MMIIDSRSNYTVIAFNGGEILFSYQTPVAGFAPGTGYFKTDTHYSTTTSRHINRYLPRRDALIVSQRWIDSLIEIDEVNHD